MCAAITNCSDRWLAMENTNVLGGRSDAAMTLSRCQSVCVNNVDCTGLDWNTTASSGQSCWLTGPWSGGWRIGVARGITHYNLTREDCRKCANMSKHEQLFNYVNGVRFCINLLGLHNTLHLGYYDSRLCGPCILSLISIAMYNVTCRGLNLLC